MADCKLDRIRTALKAAPQGLTLAQTWEAIAAAGTPIEIGSVRQLLSNGVVRGLFTSTNKRPAVYRLMPSAAALDESAMPLHVRIEALLGDINGIRRQAGGANAPEDIRMGLDSLQRTASRVLRELGR